MKMQKRSLKENIQGHFTRGHRYALGFFLGNQVMSIGFENSTNPQTQSDRIVFNTSRLDVRTAWIDGGPKKLATPTWYDGERHHFASMSIYYQQPVFVANRAEHREPYCKIETEFSLGDYYQYHPSELISGFDESDTLILKSLLNLTIEKIEVATDSQDAKIIFQNSSTQEKLSLQIQGNTHQLSQDIVLSWQLP